MPGNPSLEAMHTVVNVDKRRPTLPDHWLEDEVSVLRLSFFLCDQCPFVAGHLVIAFLSVQTLRDTHEDM